MTDVKQTWIEDVYILQFSQELANVRPVRLEGADGNIWFSKEGNGIDLAELTKVRNGSENLFII